MTHKEQKKQIFEHLAQLIEAESINRGWRHDWRYIKNWTLYSERVAEIVPGANAVQICKNYAGVYSLRFVAVKGLREDTITTWDKLDQGARIAASHMLNSVKATPVAKIEILNGGCINVLAF